MNFEDEEMSEVERLKAELRDRENALILAGRCFRKAMAEIEEMQKKENCEWVRDEWEDYFATQCGNTFQFIVDGPEENDFKFCPYCGGRLVEVEDKRK